MMSKVNVALWYCRSCDDHWSLNYTSHFNIVSRMTDNDAVWFRSMFTNFYMGHHFYQSVFSVRTFFCSGLLDTYHCVNIHWALDSQYIISYSFPIGLSLLPIPVSRHAWSVCTTITVWLISTSKKGNRMLVLFQSQFAVACSAETLRFMLLNLAPVQWAEARMRNL